MTPSKTSVWFRNLRDSFVTFARRLPKNLRSNRWWIVWNRSLYIVSTSHEVGADTQRPSFDTISLGMSSYVHWRLRIRGRKTPELCDHGLFVPEMGMFGNMTRRLAGALTLSRLMGVGNVIVPPSAEFQGGIFRSGVHHLSQETKLWLFSEGKPSAQPVTVLHKLDPLTTPMSGQKDIGEASQWAWERLSTLFVEKVGPKLDPNHIVIHIRGGDVFGPRKPASYGQPPLSYYTFVLQRKKWSHVTVVTSDDDNPVVESLLSWCRERKLRVSIQRGSLREDLAFLFRAQTLVAGRGTFMPAVCGLSRHAKTVYFFENKFTLIPPVSGLDTIRVIDREGTYVREVLNNNWRNSPHQRQLMVSYPERNLSLDL